jgi:hypothetical protein
MTNRRQKPSQTLVIAQNPFSNLTVGRKQEVDYYQETAELGRIKSRPEGSSARMVTAT